MILLPVNELRHAPGHYAITEPDGRYVCDVAELGGRWTVTILLPKQSRLTESRGMLHEATWATKDDAVLNVRKLLTAELRRAA